MSFSLALLKKVRCRFLHSDSGAPVSGVVATLTIGFGESNRRTRIPLGSLCSDGAGYVSFDLKPLIARGIVSAERLLLVGTRLPNGEVDLLDMLLKKGSANGDNVPGSLSSMDLVGPSASDDPDASLCIVFPVTVSEAAKDGKNVDCANVSLPSIQSPDVGDYEASPFSFVTQSAVSLGDDCCESLVPASLPVQEHKFYKVVVRRDENVKDSGRIKNLSGVKEVSVTGNLTARAPKLRFAEVLEFKQQWFSLGHSLGEIKYSLALAPGEATQVAIIDWSRQDSTARTDNVLANEYMDHSLKRDRSIEETIDSALRESQGGSSFMAGTSGQATIPLQYVTLSFNHAIGYGVSNSWGNRNLEAESLQDLHDKIRQQSGYTRSLNSTVVVQASQAEQNVLQTRKVANHNHCHALTIQYYEVLRHFKIRTTYAGRRKAILVPFKLFVFTWELALQFRSILEPVLIDPSLRKCFDAMFRCKVTPTIYEEPTTPGVPPPTPAPAPAPVNKRLTNTFDVLTYLAGGNGSNIYVKSGDHIRISATGEAFTGGFVTFGPDGHADIGTPDFMAPGLRKFSLIFKVGTGGPWNQGGSIVSDFVADRDGELIFNMNDIRNDYDNNRPENHSAQKDRWAVEVTYPSHEIEPAAPATPGSPVAAPEPESSVVSQPADELCSAKLLAHLNGNQGYYNGCVWILQNPIERRLRLEAALGGHADLLDAIDDVPLAISGNYVAFAYDGPTAGWQAARESDPRRPIEDIVTLPTRGVFAEAQLGHCNACEERDPTRMWNWNEMTIETPPDIGGVTPGPRGQTPSITPAQLPANVIQITQPQAAPDPTGLAAALRVLGTPDIFRDMSGLDEVSSLLETLSQQSSDANTKALAQQAQNKLAQAKSGAAGHTGGSSDHGVRAQATEPDAAKQIDRLKALEYGKSKGLIDDAAAADAAETMVGGGPGGSSWIMQQLLHAAPVVTKVRTTETDPGWRACCALGQWKGGQFPGALDPTLLGGHRKGGLTPGGPQGYVYTRSAGLVDLGHVRDLADFTKFVYDALVSGATLLELDEGIASVFALPVDQTSRLELAGAIAYVESWAHELRSWPDYSAFSPEDICSNIIGIECGKRAILKGGSFDTSMDYVLDHMANTELNAVPKSDTDAVLLKIEDDWFSVALGLTLLRRNFDGTPWMAGMSFDAPISIPWLNPASFGPFYSEFTYKVSGLVDGKSGVTLVTMQAATDSIRARFVAANPGKDRP